MRTWIAVALFLGLLASTKLVAETTTPQTTKESVYGKLNAILKEVRARPDQAQMTDLLREELYLMKQQMEGVTKDVELLNREIRDLSRTIDKMQRDIDRLKK